MQKTTISWTDFSSNPLKFRDAERNQIVWGCVKVSPGCLHCYSETLALRYKRGKVFNAANMRELKPFMCEDELKEILTKKKAGGVEVSGKRCFVGDMTDLFGEWVTDEMLDRLFATFALRPDVTFQILTKRAERLQRYLSEIRLFGTMFRAMGISYQFPLPNVWVGVSCENQAQADKRLPFLLATPAAVRFASFEPLLGDIRVFDPSNPYPIQNPIGPRVGSGLLDWAIVGGESGPHARPMNPRWAESLRDQCQRAGVPFFFKQWGEWVGEMHPAATDGQMISEVFVQTTPDGDYLGQYMHKVGKKAAGRRLAGLEWNEFPQVKS